METTSHFIWIEINSEIISNIFVEILDKTFWNIILLKAFLIYYQVISLIW